MHIAPSITCGWFVEVLQCNCNRINVHLQLRDNLTQAHEAQKSNHHKQSVVGNGDKRKTAKLREEHSNVHVKATPGEHLYIGLLYKTFFIVAPSPYSGDDCTLIRFNFIDIVRDRNIIHSYLLIYLLQGRIQTKELWQVLENADWSSRPLRIIAVTVIRVYVGPGMSRCRLVLGDK